MRAESYEELVRETAWAPTGDLLRAHLAQQTVLYEEPVETDLTPLAEAIEARFGGERIGAGELGERSSQPLWHFYRAAFAYEAGEDDRALAALERALALDGREPIAAHLAAHLRGEAGPSVSSAERLTVLSRMADALMAEPYGRAVETIAAAVRDTPRPRVLEVGVGGGAQILALWRRLSGDPGSVEALDVVGLDVVPEYLERVAGRVEEQGGEALLPITFEPILGDVATIDAEALRRIAAGGVSAINASIVLHEVPGESKLAALRNLRQLGASTLALAEWNFSTENVFSERDLIFLFNVRGAAAAMAAAVRPRHGLRVARDGVHVWLGQGDDQLVGAATTRQECFLPAPAWERVLGLAGWSAERTDQGLFEGAAPAPIVTWEAAPKA